MSCYMNNICFRGGGETTGSVAHSSNTGQITYLTNKQPSFKADSFEYSSHSNKKKHTGLKVIAGTLIAAAAVVGGLGCASKYSNKLPECLDFLKKDGFAKVTKQCHEWCHWTVDKGRTAWIWAKGLFSKNNA